MHKYGDRIWTWRICSEQSNCRQKDIWYLNSIKFGQTSPGDLFRNTGAALCHPMGIESHRGGRHRVACELGESKLLRKFSSFRHFEAILIHFVQSISSSNITCNSFRHFVISSFRHFARIWCFASAMRPMWQQSASRAFSSWKSHSCRPSRESWASYLRPIHDIQKCTQNQQFEFVQFTFFQTAQLTFWNCRMFCWKVEEDTSIDVSTELLTHERQLCLTKHPSPGRQRSCACPNDIEGLCRLRFKHVQSMFMREWRCGKLIKIYQVFDV